MKYRKLVAVLNLIAFIAMVTVNALASILPINGLDTGEISNLYPNLFTPAGITFSIWGVIYILLLIYVIYQIKVAWRASKIEPTIVDHISYWFMISSIANIGWILAWHYRNLVLSLIIMVILLISLIVIYIRLDIGKYHPSKTERYMVDMPFSIYLGWISVATIANVVVLLNDTGWSKWGLDDKWWTIIVIIVAVLLAIRYIANRRDVFYGLVIDWALFGIYLERSKDVIIIDEVIYVLLGGIFIISVYMIYRIIRGDAY
ncbi:MAG: tryptophan-rich sensory protein [Vallitaleaceae bacterium]|jgi:hypothetical protein|nr:tryptophan-rich sensory protein [Vallitaleaceae bacterium]